MGWTLLVSRKSRVKPRPSKYFVLYSLKGLLALLIGTLGATHGYGVDKIVLDSLARTMAKNDFLGIVRQQLAKGVISAGTHDP